MSNEKITSLDVYKFYNQKIKDSVSKNTNEYIDKIFDNSNYDKKLADELVSKIDIQNEQIEAYNKKFWSISFFKIINIVIGLLMNWFGISWLDSFYCVYGSLF